MSRHRTVGDTYAIPVTPYAIPVTPSVIPVTPSVIPAKAGISDWNGEIPAYAGMTDRVAAGMTDGLLVEVTV